MDQQRTRPAESRRHTKTKPEGSTQPSWSGPVERVDPYEIGEGAGPRLQSPADELVRARLAELRARISALDVEVAGLMARREALTRVAFDLVATGASGG